MTSMTMAEYYYSVIHDHPAEFKQGIEEAHLSTGVTYDGDPESPRSIAYDLGRTLGEAIGLNYCDHGPTVYENYCPKCTEG